MSDEPVADLGCAGDLAQPDGVGQAIAEDLVRGGLIDGLAARLASTERPIARARLELTAMVALSAVVGWAVLGDTIDRAFGRVAPIEHDVLRSELTRMLRAYAVAP